MMVVQCMVRNANVRKAKSKEDRWSKKRMADYEWCGCVISLCDTYVSRVRAGLGSKGDCVLKRYVPRWGSIPSISKVQWGTMQSCFRKDGSLRRWLSSWRIDSSVPSRPWKTIRWLSRFWWWLWLWHARDIVCASSCHIHWCVDESEDHESLLGVFVFAVWALAVMTCLMWWFVWWNKT